MVGSVSKAVLHCASAIHMQRKPKVTHCQTISKRFCNLCFSPLPLQTTGQNQFSQCTVVVEARVETGSPLITDPDDPLTW